MVNYIINKQHYKTLIDIKTICEKSGRVSFYISSTQYPKDILDDLSRLKCIYLYNAPFDLNDWGYEVAIAKEGKNQILKYKLQKAKSRRDWVLKFATLFISIATLIKSFC